MEVVLSDFYGCNNAIANVGVVVAVAATIEADLN